MKRAKIRFILFFIYVLTYHDESFNIIRVNNNENKPQRNGENTMKNMDMKELKLDLIKAIRNEEGVTVAVKIYDCDESGQTYDVEVAYYFEGEYQDCFVSDTYETEAEAVKRGKVVLRSLKTTLDRHEEIEVLSTVEVYTN